MTRVPLGNAAATAVTLHAGLAPDAASPLADWAARCRSSLHRRSGSLVLALVAALAGCAPHYRADELRALRSADGQELQELSQHGAEAMAAGKAGAAASDYERAVALAPTDGNYLQLARARQAAGQSIPARAAAKQGLMLQGAYAPELRAFLSRSYADDGLFEVALDHLPSAELSAAMEVPALARALDGLAAADRQVRAGDGAGALKRYGEWLDAYGVPDHPLLRKWSDEVLRLCPAVGAKASAEGQRAETEGRTEDALGAYAFAARFQPSSEFDATTRARFEAIVARSSGAVPPEALAAAKTAADALDDDHLGDALSGYRRAIALAPYWAEPRYNLAQLLSRVEQNAEAALQMRAYIKLTKDASRGNLAQTWASIFDQRVTLDSPENVRLRLASTDAELMNKRTEARDWRDRGWLLVSSGTVLGAGALTCALLGRRGDEQIQSGALPTGVDIALTAQLGQTYNLVGTGLAIAGGALVAAGIPIVLTHLDPADPELSAQLSVSASGFALTGRFP